MATHVGRFPNNPVAYSTRMVMATNQIMLLCPMVDDRVNKKAADNSMGYVQH